MLINTETRGPLINVCYFTRLTRIIHWIEIRGHLHIVCGILLRTQSLLIYTETRGHLMSHYKMEIHQNLYTVERSGITFSGKARQQEFDNIIIHCTNSQWKTSTTFKTKFRIPCYIITIFISITNIIPDKR